MRAFFKRHLFVHIWALGVLALFAVYWYGASSPAAANAVTGVTQPSFTHWVTPVTA